MPHATSILALLFTSLLVGCTAPADDPVPEDPGMDAGESATPSEPSYVWARKLSGPSQEDEVDAVASDAEGNVYISGKFEQSLSIEGHPELLVSAGMADIMVASYTRDGALRWVRRFGGVGEDNVFDAAVDASGNVYLSGYFGGTVDFGGVQLSSTGTADLDLMVVKMSSAGDVVWAVRAGGPSGDGGNEINIAADGTVIVVGGSKGNFHAGSIAFSFAGPGQYAMLLTLDPSTGAFRWGAQIAGAGVSRLKCLGVDSVGNVYAGGDYGGAVSVIGPNRTDALPATQGGLDAFLTAWTPGGQLRWSKGWGGEGADLCKGLEATATGELYAVGYVTEGAMFDGVPLMLTGRDLFVWKLDAATGASRWLQHVWSDTDLTGAEAILAPDGGILFGHDSAADVTYSSSDGNDLTFTVPGNGVDWPLLAGYSPDGVPRTPLVPAQNTGDAHMDEASRSGTRVYIDVPIFGGTYEFGADVRTGGGTKDALLVAVDL